MLYEKFGQVCHTTTTTTWSPRRSHAEHAPPPPALPAEEEDNNNNGSIVVVVIMSRIEKLKKVQLYSLFRDITRLRLRAKGMDEKHGAITKKLNLLWHHYKEPDNRSELLKYLECRTNAEQKLEDAMFVDRKAESSPQPKKKRKVQMGISAFFGAVRSPTPRQRAAEPTAAPSPPTSQLASPVLKAAQVMSIEAFLDETIRIKDVKSFMNHTIVKRPPILLLAALAKAVGAENIIRANLDFYEVQVLGLTFEQCTLF